MKTSKTHHRRDALNPAIDATGERLGQVLLGGVEQLDAHVVQRLRAAREQAVEQHRLALVHAAQKGLAVAGHPRGVDGSADASGQQWWQSLASIGMVLALLLGLWLIDAIQSENSLRDAAEIDQVLLTDELPPAAYVDPGFKHFLKLSYPATPL